MQFQVACNKVPATKCPQQRRAEKPEASQGQSSTDVTSNDSEPLGSSWASIMMPHAPLFPNPRGKTLTKSQVNDVIRKVVQRYDLTISAHTFRITGAKWYAKMGIDCPTIALHGRWSSSAVMTYEYLAEAPLASFKTKTKPPRLLSNTTAREVLQSQSAMKSGTRSRLLGKRLHLPILWRKMQSSRDMS